VVDGLLPTVDPVDPATPVPPRRSGRPRRVARRSPRRLSWEVIVDAALAVIDAEGIEALTMRRVAEELGTGAASLYAHFADKKEIVEAVLDRVIGEVPLPKRIDPKRWQAQLKQIALDSRAVFQRHGNIAQATLGSIPTGEHALPLIDKMLGILLAAGVSPQTAAWSIDILGLYVSATATEESLEATDLAVGHEDRSFYVQLREFWAAQPTDRFPHLAPMAEALTSGDGDQRYEFGLDILLRGIASTLDERGHHG
jgi:AcrR family transcriptional regulator